MGIALFHGPNLLISLCSISTFPDFVICFVGSDFGLSLSLSPLDFLSFGCIESLVVFLNYIESLSRSEDLSFTALIIDQFPEN